MVLPWWWFPAALSTLICLAFLNPDLAAPNGRSCVDYQLVALHVLTMFLTGSLHLRWLSRHIIMRALFFTTGLSVPYHVSRPHLHLTLSIIASTSGLGPRSQELDHVHVYPGPCFSTRSRHCVSHHALPCADIDSPPCCSDWVGLEAVFDCCNCIYTRGSRFCIVGSTAPPMAPSVMFTRNSHGNPATTLFNTVTSNFMGPFISPLIVAVIV